MIRRQKHRLLFVTYAAFILFWVIVAAALRITSTFHQPSVRDAVLIDVPDADPQESIEVGLFAENFYGFEPAHETFKADGWIWLKWPARFQKILEQRSIEGARLIHLTNLVEDWDSRLEPGLDEPIPLPDGRFYQKYRFSGYFNATGVDYHKYPFQTLSLPISVELSEAVSVINQQAMPLRPDRLQSGIGDYIGVSGYVFEGLEILSGLHTYPSLLGLESLSGSPQKSQVRFKVAYRKSPNTTFLKLLMPLVTVMTLTLFAPSLSATGWDVRVGIPPTALLSLIFLQQGYHDQIPELSYLTYLDTIYNVCYLVNLVLFGLFLWGSNEYHSAPESERARVTEHIADVDRRFQLGLAIFVLVLLLVNWFSISIRFG